ncbi:metal-dependent hydrolase [Paenibacillus pasadenensis]|nr:metal-dependent hydrolase [Paenibacillus pasadenensis]
MMGRSHLIISTGLTLSAVHLAGEPITWPMLAVVAVSSLLPDLDEPNSLLVSRSLTSPLMRMIEVALVFIGAALFLLETSYSPWNYILGASLALASFLPVRTLRLLVMFAAGVALLAFGESLKPWGAVAGAVLMACAVLPHRGMTHSLYGLAAWSAILYAAAGTSSPWLWLAGSMSYLLHLVADSLTNRGIRPLPPLPFRLSLKLMSTGSRWGGFIEGAFVLLTAAIVYLVFLRDAMFLQAIEQLYN